VSDIINLLPDHIANQIAAGEVIQRPASAVKEMLENAVDANATQIHLIIKDAGKELIRVIDNGKGMSTTDARMCFERHATSKIQKIEDLFSIRTMGFRGEALASIAAVAQVELKSKMHTDEAGTLIQIENSIVQKQEPCAMAGGTSLSVKNLFFNVPARRNFLKSNTTEIRNIVEEFTRVAMAFPEIGFKLTNNETDIFNLEISGLKQRIVNLLGTLFQNKLVAVEQDTEYVKITGFIGTPNAATKTRGNQYFFVNQRFIKSAYLNHAVSTAYQSLIAKDEFPAFVLFLDINPEKVDANVHPTKQEIKFEDEKIIYSFVNSAIKHALSKNSIAPSIDFDLDPNITQLPSITQPFTQSVQQTTANDYLFKSFKQAGQSHFIDNKPNTKNWQELYKIADDIPQAPSLQMPLLNAKTESENIESENNIWHDHEIKTITLWGKYILYSKQSGFMLIDIYGAQERIIYDSLSLNFGNNASSVQQLLHPITFEVNIADAILLLEMQKDLLALGFQIEPFGNQTFIIQGVPSDISTGNEITLIQQILEQIKHESSDIKLDAREKLLRTISWQKALRSSSALGHAMCHELCAKLFASSNPTFTPRGKKIILDISIEAIEKGFNT
jgi:DNA mismatch repair protein MutL